MSELRITQSQAELVRGLSGRYPPDSVDRLWLFPAHLGKVKETGFVVLSLLPPPDQVEDDRRTLVTIRYEAEPSKGRLQRTERLDEEGRAPPERIDRIIAGVISRSAVEISEPLVVEIAGDGDRWTDLLRRIGALA
jgi:hypothetical protein